MSTDFTEFLGLAVLSLAITFVLFRWLESRADAQHALLGGTIKYGGALAGFVLVFWLSSRVYATSFSGGDRTEISLAGEYDLRQQKANGQERSGWATIRQRNGRPDFDISGEVESVSTPPSVSFQTVVGVIKGRRLIWLYENARREMGFALGDVRSDHPDRIVLLYADVLGSDLNADVEGRLVLTRRDPDAPGR
ncbi:MAG TPA: hypothetical protein VHG51_02335 [Longimicrobiaceae bacterium]|nr:hypothetical protein [Longimicrobiaceae bacterium]